MNGTFFIYPKKCYQVYIIHACIKTHQFHLFMLIYKEKLKKSILNFYQNLEVCYPSCCAATTVFGFPVVGRDLRGVGNKVTHRLVSQ